MTQSETKTQRKKIDTNSLLKQGESIDEAAIRLHRVVLEDEKKREEIQTRISKTKADIRHLESKITTRNNQAKAAAAKSE